MRAREPAGHLSAEMEDEMEDGMHLVERSRFLSYLFFILPPMKTIITTFELFEAVTGVNETF